MKIMLILSTELGITVVCTAATVLLLTLIVNGIMVSLVYKTRNTPTKKTNKMNDGVQNSQQETIHEPQPQQNEIIYEEVDQVFEDNPVYNRNSSYYSYPKMEKNIAPDSKESGEEEYLHIMSQSQQKTVIEVTGERRENHSIEQSSAPSLDQETSDIKRELNAEKEEIHYFIPSKN